MVALPVYVDIDLRKNHMIQMALEVLAAHPGSPSTGYVYFNSVSKTVFYYDGTVWVEVVAGTLHYTHTQGSGSNTWVITHNMGYKPNVTAFDSTGDEVHGDLVHNSVNQLTITFSASISGEALLS